HRRPPSFPTRRSSDLDSGWRPAAAAQRVWRGRAGLGDDLLGLGDKIVPDFGGDLAARDLVHRAVVVVPDPDADDDIGSETGKPRDRKSTRLNSSHLVI